MKPKRLLLVDDDTVALATFGNGLIDAGYLVEMADKGSDGLRIAANAPDIDLAIIDMRMPGLSGIDTAKGLEQLGIPWVFLSAYNDESVVQSAVDGGALGYMVKPIDVAKAIPTIESAVKTAQDISFLKAVETRLTGALDTGNLVNVAIGIIMERQKLTRQDAFEILRSKARSERRKVKDIAEEYLDAWENFNQMMPGKNLPQDNLEM